MLRLICSFVLVFSAFAVYADVFEHPLKDISAAEKVIYKPEELSGDFEQVKNITSLGVALKSNGEFSIKGNGILWKNLLPIQSSTIIQNGNVCMFSGGKKSSINAGENAALKEMLAVLSSIFTHDYAEISGYFDIFFEELEQGAVLGLRSKDRLISAVIYEMSIEINKYINKIVFSDKNGDVTVITFSNVTEEGVDEFGCE